MGNSAPVGAAFGVVGGGRLAAGGGQGHPEGAPQEGRQRCGGLRRRTGRRGAGRLSDAVALRFGTPKLQAKRRRKVTRGTVYNAPFLTEI